MEKCKKGIRWQFNLEYIIKEQGRERVNHGGRVEQMAARQTYEVLPWKSDPQLLFSIASVFVFT